MQAFIDAAAPGWSVLRSRRPPPGGGPLFIATVELRDPCRESGEATACDRLPSLELPASEVAIRIETAREILAPASLVTASPVGNDLVVNGFRTKLVRFVVGGSCFASAADETVTVVIRRSETGSAGRRSSPAYAVPA